MLSITIRKAFGVGFDGTRAMANLNQGNTGKKSAPVLIIGGGIGGLTLALNLHHFGISSLVFEMATSIKSLGVGINLLPHAMREMSNLKLESAIASNGIETQEVGFYNRFGQHIFSEPRGRYAGYKWPQYSIHRGDLQLLLVKAVKERLGPQAIVTGHTFCHAKQSKESVTAHFIDTKSHQLVEPVTGSVIVGCDGIHSAVRHQLYPKDKPPVYSGITMWRGVTWRPAFLTGASMIYAGSLETGKTIFYPIKNQLNRNGLQLINWLCEFYTSDKIDSGEWNRSGNIEDFLWAFEDMKFDWLNIPESVRESELILEYPMVDKDPLERWSFGRMTLLGDAAHPMYPRGSNGAGQAILDASALAIRLSQMADLVAALEAYENDRLIPTSKVVQANREIPPDIILKEIYERTGDKPFDNINNVISPYELAKLSEKYKKVAGFSREILETQPVLI